MTTLIGMETKEGDVVLASDLTRTRTDLKDQGDVIVKEHTQSGVQKYFKSEDDSLVIGMTGVADPAYFDLLHAMIDGKINFKDAVRKGFFDELNKTNMQRWGYRAPSNENNALLVGLRDSGETGLFLCYPLGHIERVNWRSIGSGSQHASEYVASHGMNTPPYLSTSDSIDMAVNSIDAAARDIYTGGLDLVVIRPDGITNPGEKIRADVRRASQRSLKQVMKQYE
ncbi:hypothetical protein HOC80_05095 [archaeon]|nr:hypothetical protein [archaeon]MBT4417449.1 hypothetical protein [archaeon]